MHMGRREVGLYAMSSRCPSLLSDYFCRCDLAADHALPHECRLVSKHDGEKIRYEWAEKQVLPVIPKVAA